MSMRLSVSSIRCFEARTTSPSAFIQKKFYSSRFQKGDDYLKKTQHVWGFVFGLAGVASILTAVYQYSNDLRTRRGDRARLTDHEPSESARQIAKAKDEVAIFAGSGAEIFGHRAPGFTPKGNPECFQIVEKLNQGVKVCVLVRDLTGQMCQTPESSLEEMKKQLHALANARKILEIDAMARKHLELRREGVLEFGNMLSHLKTLPSKRNYSGQFSGRFVDHGVSDAKEKQDTSFACVYDRLTGNIEALHFSIDKCQQRFYPEYLFGRGMACVNGLHKRCTEDAQLLAAYEGLAKERWGKATVLWSSANDLDKLDFTQLDFAINQLRSIVFNLEVTAEKERVKISQAAAGDKSFS